MFSLALKVGTRFSDWNEPDLVASQLGQGLVLQSGQLDLAEEHLTGGG
jgi:hypothetical protein